MGISRLFLCPDTSKIGGLRGLYLHYCYQLGILPKNRSPVNPGQLHFLLREDLRKLDTISKETRLLCHYHIDTAEELFSLRKDLQRRMEQLTDERKHLRYKIRSIKDGVKLSESKAEISGLTEQIGELRKVVHMSTYEVLTLLILYGTFLITLLAYIDRKNKRK